MRAVSGHALLFGRNFRCQLNGAGDGAILFAYAVQQPFFLQSPQVAHHAIRRADLKMLANFAYGRAVAAGLNSVLDELKDGSLAGGQLIE